MEKKSESDRPKREKGEWIVWWVVGLGGEHVGTNNLIFFVFLNWWDDKKPPELPIMTFHIPSHLTIYIPLYPWFNESFKREF